jgi:hypothetical protein
VERIKRIEDENKKYEGELETIKQRKIRNNGGQTQTTTPYED